jgi:Tol biopolymer transport system component
MGYFAASANGVLAYRAGAARFDNRQLMWFDRAGKSLGTLGPPANYDELALSPDGLTVAVAERSAQGFYDIWLLDVARGVPTRFTFDTRSSSRYPIWSPDSSRVVFASSRARNFDLYEKAASGSGSERLLFKNDQDKRPNSWSPDGTHILFTPSDPKTQLDLWTLPVSSASGSGSQPALYLQTPASELQGQFSPDGHWIAYMSDEARAGQYQVYVQSYPPGGGKFQISTGDGGAQPRWRRDGKELFYVAPDGRLVAVDVKTASRFEAGAPHPLFQTYTETPAAVSGSFRYDVSADGKRFIVSPLVAASAAGAVAPPITVVLNWTTGLRQ